MEAGIKPDKKRMKTKTKTQEACTKVTISRYSTFRKTSKTFLDKIATAAGQNRIFIRQEHSSDYYRLFDLYFLSETLIPINLITFMLFIESTNTNSYCDTSSQLSLGRLVIHSINHSNKANLTILIAEMARKMLWYFNHDYIIYQLPLNQVHHFEGWNIIFNKTKTKVIISCKTSGIKTALGFEMADLDNNQY